MCAEDAIKKIIAAAIIAVGFWVFISGFVMQIALANTQYTGNTLEIMGRYFAGFVIMGIGKYVVWCTGSHKAAKKKKR